MAPRRVVFLPESLGARPGGSLRAILRLNNPAAILPGGLFLLWLLASASLEAEVGCSGPVSSMGICKPTTPKGSLFLYRGITVFSGSLSRVFHGPELERACWRGALLDAD